MYSVLVICVMKLDSRGRRDALLLTACRFLSILLRQQCTHGVATCLDYSLFAFVPESWTQRATERNDTPKLLDVQAEDAD